MSLLAAAFAQAEALAQAQGHDDPEMRDRAGDRPPVPRRVAKPKKYTAPDAGMSIRLHIRLDPPSARDAAAAAAATAPRDAVSAENPNPSTVIVDYDALVRSQLGILPPGHRRRYDAAPERQDSSDSDEDEDGYASKDKDAPMTSDTDAPKKKRSSRNLQGMDEYDLDDGFIDDADLYHKEVDFEAPDIQELPYFIWRGPVEKYYLEFAPDVGKRKPSPEPEPAPPKPSKAHGSTKSATPSLASATTPATSAAATAPASAPPSMASAMPAAATAGAVGAAAAAAAAAAQPSVPAVAPSPPAALQASPKKKRRRAVDDATAATAAGSGADAKASSKTTALGVKKRSKSTAGVAESPSLSAEHRRSVVAETSGASSAAAASPAATTVPSKAAAKAVRAAAMTDAAAAGSASTPATATKAKGPSPSKTAKSAPASSASATPALAPIFTAAAAAAAKTPVAAAAPTATTTTTSMKAKTKKAATAPAPAVVEAVDLTNDDTAMSDVIVVSSTPGIGKPPSAKKPKVAKKVKPQPLSPTVARFVDIVRQKAAAETWANKAKFPQHLRPPLHDAARAAIDEDALDANFFAVLKEILPYNTFTLTKLVAKMVLPEKIGQARQTLDQLHIAFTERVQQLLAVQRPAFQARHAAWEAETTALLASSPHRVMPDGTPVELPDEPKRRFQWDARLRDLFARIMTMEHFLCELQNELAELCREPAPCTEHSARRQTYARLLAAFGDEPGWVDSNQLSSRWSDLRRQRIKRASGTASTATLAGADGADPATPGSHPNGATAGAPPVGAAGPSVDGAAADNASAAAAGTPSSASASSGRQLKIGRSYENTVNATGNTVAELMSPRVSHASAS
ncbi:hypothetical protein CXG81DRAFT_26737 [Caulochytrium protostelioides]|uniref:Ubinuclein middle domain-containing protein n=1 Tax=Caulochytrium protostelioides TaxID=1555241 RepID=A0A4P9X5W9_9FUNG|nr:hypothetical protein CXG81DRAFT_26737 [Caulochytrium protostelioides]|eukprot:RKP00554.1 hypothetical protein CXG81DRAFT_26737 [Caulochytrium protostelioides]